MVNQKEKETIKKKYSLKYRNKTFYFTEPLRTGICECCGKASKTQSHHWLYKYKTKEVVKNKELAKENTTELCYYCHKLANCLVHLNEQQIKTLKLKELMRSQLGKRVK